MTPDDIVKKQIIDYATSVDPLEAAERLDVQESTVRRWAEKPDKVPSSMMLKVVRNYYENVVLFAKQTVSQVPLFQQVLAEWEAKEVAILFPAYREVNLGTCSAIWGLALDGGKDKIRLIPRGGDAVIANTRGRLASQFLNTECKWSLWIDDDIVPPIGRPRFIKDLCHLDTDFPDDVLNVHVMHQLLGTALKKGVYMVSGVYFGRRPMGQPIFGTALHNKVHYAHARKATGEVFDTNWAGMGCALIHRKVFEDMQQKFPDLSPENNSGQFEAREQLKWWDFFRQFPGKGEDVSFFERAAECGHKVLIDTKVQCLHVGRHCYHFQNTKELKFK